MQLSGWVLVVVVVLGIGALVPVVWASVDAARRPTWQLSGTQKAVWIVSLVVGWALLWPVALATAVFYLTVLRKRLELADRAAHARSAAPVSVAPVGQSAPPTPEPDLDPRKLPPAGWYPDPAGDTGAQRWWDGRGWTFHLRARST